ncbi:MAG: S1C family serine protease [Akkermansiaceae bacterium]
MKKTTTRPTLLPSLSVIASAIASAIAAVTLITSTPAHSATSVENIEQLKALQTKVQAVAKKVLPATVSLTSARSGASGSGVIVNKEGLILTAGHVIRGAKEVTVTFPDGKQTRGKVLGANFTRDSAMVQIIGKAENENGWPHVEVGNSKGLGSGTFVVALGHAGGFDPTRTPPVRFGRLMTTQNKNRFITSDCTLIGGDSGGPLFDLNGKVIGIHSSIGRSLESNNHASIQGFHEDWEKLKKGESWGRLGGSRLDNPDAPVLGIMTTRTRRGAVGIRHVFEGSGAHKAGIRAGDTIISIQGKKITNLQALHAELLNYKPGDKVAVRLQRADQIITRTVTLSRRGNR